MPILFKRFGSGVFSILAVGLLAALAAGIAAQAPAAAPAAAPVQPTELAGLAHAAIRVADLDKSRDFYAKLGFEEAFAMSRDGMTTQSFVKVNDLQFIELYPQGRPTDTVGFMHVCFESPAIDALNSAYAALGLAPIPVRKAAAGNLLFTMSGPEKQNIEYTQYMPGSRHSNDKGLHTVLAINSADDERNPPQTGVTDKALTQVKNARLYLIPASTETHGHRKTGYAKFWAPQLVDFLRRFPTGR